MVEEEEEDGWMGCVEKQMFTSTEKLTYILFPLEGTVLRCHHLLLGQL